MYNKVKSKLDKTVAHSKILRSELSWISCVLTSSLKILGVNPFILFLRQKSNKKSYTMKQIFTLLVAFMALQQLAFAQRICGTTEYQTMLEQEDPGIICLLYTSPSPRD